MMQKYLSLYPLPINFVLMKPWFFIFFLLPLLGFAYVVWHVWQILPLSPSWKGAVVGLMLLSVVCLFSHFLIGPDSLPLAAGRVVYEVGTSSLFILLYLVMIFLLLDIGRLVRLVPPSFLHHSVAGSVGILLFVCALFVYANANYRNKQMRTMELHAARPLSSPMRIVMLSDMHIGYHNPVKELARWVDMINAESPDVVLIAGDIIDGSMKPLREENMAAEFRRIKAPVYACPGNHEYYAGIADAKKFFREAGITLLCDSSVVVGGELTVIGRDDRSHAGRNSVARLVSEAPKTKYTILLDHQPYNLDRSARAGVDFQFSGHTHYGQMWPVNWIEDALYEDAYGPLRKGKTAFYVSSGMGIWGGKFRIGTSSEYVVAVLR